MKSSVFHTTARLLEPIRRFVRRRRGTSSLENTLFLAVAALAVVAGVAVLPRQTRQCLSALATTIHEPGEAASLATGKPALGESSSRSASKSSPGVALPSVGKLPMPAVAIYLLGALAVGAILVLPGAILLRKRRLRLARQASPSDDLERPADQNLQVRAFAKRQQLWQALLTDGDLLLGNGIKVRHLMTPEPLNVPPTCPVAEVREIIVGSHVRHLLVCEQGKLVGVISDRDLGRAPSGTAAEIMSRQLHTVTPATSLSAAIQMLIEKNISCLPVIEGDRLCGILSSTDLLLTLQCSLQLWMRMAQSLHAGVSGTDELDAFSRELCRGAVAARENLVVNPSVPGELPTVETPSVASP